ncbi:hypothetical protein GCM10023183_14530 [Nibribacter koreensis]|uniref:Uncharacterized protein n=1 Tax=Nibribacter koreensis TaxID=1084519 RepID=A0ABP8FG93_9BACT
MEAEGAVLNTAKSAREITLAKIDKPEFTTTTLKAEIRQAKAVISQFLLSISLLSFWKVSKAIKSTVNSR